MRIIDPRRGGRRGPGRTAVLLVLVSLASAPALGGSAQPPAPAAPPDGWWRGNTHTHSTLSDGNASPEEMAQRYRDLGYHFLVLTDHNTWSDFEQYSTPEFLCFDGDEVTYTTNHTNGIDLDSAPARGPIQQVVDAIHAQGGLAHVNHPTETGLTASDLLPIQGLRFVEIYNARTGDRDEPIWDELLSAGKLVYGVASDDAHEIATGVGWAWVMVRAASLDRSAILAALAAGEFYASTGVTLEAYQVLDDRIVVDSVDGDLVEFVGFGGEILQSASAPAAEYVFRGDELYVRVHVAGSGNTHAWTQPVFRRQPFPDAHADAVVEASAVDPGSPASLLGPPYEGQLPAHWATSYAARILAGGQVVLDMGEGEEGIDRDGPDLCVEELDAEDGLDTGDLYRVWASLDGSSWHHLGPGVGDACFDLDGALPAVRYVKITVDVGDAGNAGDAEIDAVTLLHLGPVPTATPSPTPRLGVRLELATTQARPGDPFWVTGYLDNPGPEELESVPTFFVLEAGGLFWFWPGWALLAPPDHVDADFEVRDLPVGSTPVEVIPELTWPDTGSDSARGLHFYGALLDQAMAEILGEMAVVEWGFGW